MSCQSLSMAPYFLQSLIRRPQATQGERPLLVVLRSLSWAQWALLACGWLAWTCDAMDFFSVSFVVTRLQAQFNKPDASTITTAITLTLLFRPVGAIVLGMLSDRFGRKWPLVVNLLLCAAFELGSSFVQTFNQFLATRCLFGIAMGGIWGLASSTALENLPAEARGFGSGVVQLGYACGNMIAAVVNLKLMAETGQWRVLFWTAAGISGAATGLRAVLPESEIFLKVREKERALGKKRQSRKARVFARETWAMLRNHWLLCIYAVLLLTGYNFLSHGSQDLYPTYLQTSKNFDSNHASIATIIAECGAVAGSAVSGILSQYFGRRLVMIIFNVLIGVFIPLWIIPASFNSLSAGAFCLQFGVQGTWGVIPIYLTELAPAGFRATFPGVTYQLGNMISAASAQIEATGGNNFKTAVLKNGVATIVPNYAPVQGILMGVVAAFCIILLVIGPEKHGYHFENDKAAFEEETPLTEGMAGNGPVEDSPTGKEQDEKHGVKNVEVIPV